MVSGPVIARRPSNASRRRSKSRRTGDSNPMCATARKLHTRSVAGCERRRMPATRFLPRDTMPLPTPPSKLGSLLPPDEYKAKARPAKAAKQSASGGPAHAAAADYSPASVAEPMVVAANTTTPLRARRRRERRRAARAPGKADGRAAAAGAGRACPRRALVEDRCGEARGSRARRAARGRENTRPQGRRSRDAKTLRARHERADA